MPTSLFSPEFQAVLNAAADPASPAPPFPSPIDWRDQWIYFLMVDRFNNPGGPPKAAFDDPNFDGFQGGTFSGIKQQLPYIRGLGAGAIWLSPVLKNLPFDAHTYHGYGIHDFLRAEPRFADSPAHADDELRALVDAAHKNGLYVIMDIVLNHTGNVFAYVCDSNDKTCNDSKGGKSSFHPKAEQIQWRDATGAARADFGDIATIVDPPLEALVWPVELHSNDFFRRQGLPAQNSDDTIGDFSVLKQMLTADRDLQRFLIRAYQYVIARWDIDGFRIDTLRYLKGDLPRLFGNSMREFALSIGKKNFFTFGEVFDPNAENDIARFIGRNTQDKSELVGVDAALDFPLFFNLKPVSKGQAPPSNLVGMYANRKQVERDVLSSHGDATRFFVTFLDNHDVKERIRFVDPASPNKFDDQVALGIACLFALPGIPCIYYGTEQGLHGHGSDPAVREALWGAPGGFNKKSHFYSEIQKIANVRTAQPALRYGRFYFRPISGHGADFGVSTTPNGIVAFSRILNDEEVVAVANTDPGAAHEFDVIVDSFLNAAGDRYAILYSNKPTPTPPQPVRTIGAGDATIHEVDGSVTHGPLRVVHVKLQPMEVQILRNAATF